MNDPIPEHHSNPETYKKEPVYVFTDKAIVRPLEQKDAAGPTSTDEQSPPTQQANEPEKP